CSARLARALGTRGGEVQRHGRAAGRHARVEPQATRAAPAGGLASGRLARSGGPAGEDLRDRPRRARPHPEGGLRGRLHRLHRQAVRAEGRMAPQIAGPGLRASPSGGSRSRVPGKLPVATVRRCFSRSCHQFVHPIPDCSRLLDPRLGAADRPAPPSSDYFRDLAAWFNLAWVDPELLTIDERLVRLRDRGRNFSREDLQYILSRHRNMASGVVRLYHRLQKAGQVEVLTVPAYHPILPLLIDTDVARRSDPTAILPAR